MNFVEASQSVNLVLSCMLPSQPCQQIPESIRSRCAGQAEARVRHEFTLRETAEIVREAEVQRVCAWGKTKPGIGAVDLGECLGSLPMMLKNHVDIGLPAKCVHESPWSNMPSSRYGYCK